MLPKHLDAQQVPQAVTSTNPNFPQIVFILCTAYSAAANVETSGHASATTIDSMHKAPAWQVQHSVGCNTGMVLFRLHRARISLGQRWTNATADEAACPLHSTDECISRQGAVHGRLLHNAAAGW